MIRWIKNTALYVMGTIAAVYFKKKYAAIPNVDENGFYFKYATGKVYIDSDEFRELKAREELQKRRLFIL